MNNNIYKVLALIAVVFIVTLLLFYEKKRVEDVDTYNSTFMQMAIDLAKSNIDDNGGPFGAIIVKDGEVVGRGGNGVTRTNDPTAHAAITAIRDACNNLNTFKLEGCEIYSSCEPCPMCLSAIYWAHIKTVYYGTTKDDAAAIGFDNSFIYRELSLPLSKRKIPLIQKDHDMSQEVFDVWSNKNDKTEY